MSIEFKLPLHTVRRHNRRDNFVKYFKEKVPIGVFDVPKLAEDTGTSWRTTLAFLKELRIGGFAECQIHRPSVYGFVLYMAVWSRIK